MVTVQGMNILSPEGKTTVSANSLLSKALYKSQLNTASNATKNVEDYHPAALAVNVDDCELHDPDNEPEEDTPRNERMVLREASISRPPRAG